MKNSIFAKTIFVNLVLVLALAVSAVPAAASSPEDVTIVSHMILPPDAHAYGTFEASGPAAEAGVICPSGSVYDTKYRVAGGEHKKFTNLFVHKLFVCDDGSGTFEMDLNVRLIPGSSVTWRITSGDGEYVRLHGNGKLTGQTLPDGDLIDTYTGGLHND